MTCFLNDIDLDRIITAYEDYNLNEYNDDEPTSLVEFFKTKTLPLAYMEPSNEEFGLQIDLDLNRRAIVEEVYRGSLLVKTNVKEQFDSNEAIYEYMENLDYDELTDTDIDFNELCLEIAEHDDTPYKTMTQKQLSSLINRFEKDKEGKLRGRYIAKHSNRYIAVDNTSGDCFTEEFQTLNGAKAYIMGFDAKFIQEAEDEIAN